jgi:hypothetical protein
MFLCGWRGPQAFSDLYAIFKYFKSGQSDKKQMKMYLALLCYFVGQIDNVCMKRWRDYAAGAGV